MFDHEIRVTVFCDANRPVDTEDVFAELRATVEAFMCLLRRSVDTEDGLTGEVPRALV